MNIDIKTIAINGQSITVDSNYTVYFDDIPIFVNIKIMCIIPYFDKILDDIQYKIVFWHGYDIDSLDSYDNIFCQNLKFIQWG